MSENPPAFPRTGEGFGNPLYDTPGMSLRDWFAGQALAGMHAHPDSEGWKAEDIALDCYASANTMLAEREKAR